MDSLDKSMCVLAREGVRTRFIGRRDRANPELRAKMLRLEEQTAANERLQVGEQCVVIAAG